MSKIIITCGECGAEREVDEKLAGSILQCSECEASVRVPLPNISNGTTIGGFVLERQLGFGAMGEVWLARQTAMDRLVAVKLLAREYTLDSNFVDRFLKEVRISAKMDHPNIITAFDAGCENDVHYLALTYVDGRTLEDKIEEVGVLPEKEALGLIVEISDALRYAWNEFAILHRDIKPANIMIDKNGVAKLMDMGISKITTETAGLTMTGTIIGTPYYMSPEQGMGERDLDFHSDIYSLGATLYHIVTGILPFDATTALGIVSKHITEPLPSPLDRNPELSEHCSALIEIMMAKGADDRQNSWEEVVSDMRLVLNGEFPASKPRPSPGDSLIMPAAHSKSAEPDELGGEAVVDPLPAVADGSVAAAVAPSGKGVLIAVAAVAVVVVGALFAVYASRLDSGDRGRDVAALERPEELFDPEPEKMKEAELSSAEPLQKTPTISNPKPPLEPPVAKRKDEKLAGFADMWEFAKKYSDANPRNYDLAIENFRELSKNAAGTKYKMMADVEIARLIKEKIKSVSAILAKLKEECDAFAESGDFTKAAELCERYSGEFKEETRPGRSEMAVAYRDRGRRHADAERKRSKAEKRGRDDVRLAVAKALVQGDWEEAGNTLRKSGVTTSESAGLIRVVDEVVNARRSFTTNLRKHVGEYVTVRDSKGSRRVKIKRAKGRYIYCVEKKGRVMLQRRFPVSKISKKDVFRIAGLSGDAVLALEVAVAIRKNDVSLAIEKVSADKGAFASLLRSGLSEFEAEERFAAILDDVDIDDKNIADQKKIISAINSLASDRISADGRRMIAAFRDDFSDTRFLEKNERIIKAFESRLGVASDGGGEGDRSAPRGSRRDGAISKKGASDFDPASIRNPEDMRSLLRRTSQAYDGRGEFFFDRVGDLVMVDLYGADGVDESILQVFKFFPSIKMLSLGDTDIRDISALKGSRLQGLDLEKTDVVDLSPLKNMKTLKMLMLKDTNVKSVEPLKKLSLEMLDISYTNVSDIRPLSKMPLKGLKMSNCDVTNYSVLKKLRSLEALDPRDLWLEISGKEENADRRQRFPNPRRPPPPPDNRRRRRDDRRDFRDQDEW